MIYRNKTVFIFQSINYVDIGWIIKNEETSTGIEYKLNFLPPGNNYMPLWWSNADLAESGIKQLQLDIDFARGLKAGQWIVWGNGHEKRFGRILSKINDCFVVKNSCNDTGSVTLKELILGEVAPIDGDHV